MPLPVKAKLGWINWLQPCTLTREPESREALEAQLFVALPFVYLGMSVNRKLQPINNAQKLFMYKAEPLIIQNIMF